MNLEIHPSPSRKAPLATSRPGLTRSSVDPHHHATAVKSKIEFLFPPSHASPVKKPPLTTKKPARPGVHEKLISVRHISTNPPSYTTQQLQDMAQALQLSMDIQDRVYQKNKLLHARKVYPSSFVGSHCVDLITQLAPGGRLNRIQAVKVGVMLQERLQLFDCVNHRHTVWLVDDDDHLYAFGNDPLAVHHRQCPNKALQFNLPQKLSTFQHDIQVRVRDHTYKRQHYRQCFSGQDAVDVMLHAHLVTTRLEALALAKLFMKQQCCMVGANPRSGGDEHVMMEDDPHRYYQLLSAGERQKRMRARQQEQQQRHSQPTLDDATNKPKDTLYETLQPAQPIVAMTIVPALLIYYFLY